MTARVLIVDDILANVRLLEAKLTAEYFEVVTAMNGVDALDVINRSRPDIVLLDVMMPGMDGIEVCQRIKANPETQHIPVVIVTALDQPEDRVRGLEAGADDFLTKPVNDMALFCRVKSLLRLKMLTDELRSRAASSSELGLAAAIGDKDLLANPGNILLIDNRGHLVERLSMAIGETHRLTSIDTPQQAVFDAVENDYELIIIDLDLDNFDGLRLCSQLRSLERTRQVPILIIVDPDDHQRLMRALDMGVNDYLMRPVDRQELMARIATQIKRWRYAEQLRNSVQQSLELAVTDPLTGLFNRRYLESQIGGFIDSAANRGKALSILALDIDHFKAVNDTHGHSVGDEVLKEFANRLRQHLRGIDIACRIGGEEFLVVLPDTEGEGALKAGERLREAIGKTPFKVASGRQELAITVSVGVATFNGPEDEFPAMLKRADDALYNAKRTGRNRVMAEAA